MSSANWNSYQEWVMTKAGSTDGTMVDALVLSALGITGEGGEFADNIKKIKYHQHELTSDLRMKLALELGDVLWYIARAADALMIPLSDIAQLNVLKLNARYTRGFDIEASKTKQTDDAVAADMSKMADGTDLAKDGDA